MNPFLTLFEQEKLRREDKVFELFCAALKGGNAKLVDYQYHIRCAEAAVELIYGKQNEPEISNDEQTN